MQIFVWSHVTESRSCYARRTPCAKAEVSGEESQARTSRHLSFTDKWGAVSAVKWGKKKKSCQSWTMKTMVEFIIYLATGTSSEPLPTLLRCSHWLICALWWFNCVSCTTAGVSLQNVMGNRRIPAVSCEYKKRSCGTLCWHELDETQDNM